LKKSKQRTIRITELKGVVKQLERVIDAMEEDKAKSLDMTDYVIRIGSFNVSAHAFLRYLERAEGLKKGFKNRFTDFVFEALTRDGSYTSRKYDGTECKAYEFGVYTLIFSENGVLITIIDTSEKKEI
jgi:hypothetical protein